MTLIKGDVLPRPVGVSWFARFDRDELLDLNVGQLVWEIVDDTIVCGTVTAQSRHIKLDSLPALSGIQVFYSLGNKTHNPRLIEDKDKIPLYHITSERAARKYFEERERKGQSPVELRLVS